MDENVLAVKASMCGEEQLDWPVRLVLDKFGFLVVPTDGPTRPQIEKKEI